MALIRVYWHFNCWRPILNLQNLNLLGAGELECYICNFLWLSISLSQPQEQPHPTRKGFPLMGQIHQITQGFRWKAHSFFRSSKEAISISHVIANIPIETPHHLCSIHIAVLLLFFRTFAVFCYFFFPTRQIRFSLCHIMNVQARKHYRSCCVLNNPHFLDHAPLNCV